MMNILALDSCCGSCAVAVARDHDVVSSFLKQEDNKQAEALVLLMEEALDVAKMHYKEINVVAITKGPGSFTGVRVGFSVMRALSAVLQELQFIGFSTLEVLAHQMLPFITQDIFWMTVAAGRGRYYCQLFGSDLRSLTEIQLKNQAEVEELKISVYGDFIKRQLISAETIAQMTYRADPALFNVKIEPLYVASSFGA